MGHTKVWMSRVFSFGLRVRLFHKRHSWPILSRPCKMHDLTSVVCLAPESNKAPRYLKVFTSSTFKPFTVIVVGLWSSLMIITSCSRSPSIRPSSAVGQPTRPTYPHKWSPVSYRSSAGQGKFAGQRPTFYRCARQLALPAVIVRVKWRHSNLWSRYDLHVVGHNVVLCGVNWWRFVTLFK